MRLCGYLILVLLAGAAFGQSDEAQAKFEVADVHSSARATQPFMRGPFYGSGRFEVRFASMLDLIGIAYGVEPEAIFGGPSWLEIERYDVFAMTHGNANAETRKLMLQALLADRFELKTHKDSKPMPAFALTAGKHAQLKESDGAGETGCNFSVQNAQAGGGRSPGGGPITLPVLVWTCRNTTMAAFASGMLGMPGAGGYLNNRQVVDQTELKGTFDFALKYTPKVPAGVQVTGESIPLFEAVEKQLGLKLEASTIPLPVIAVDSVNRKPAPNPPDVEKTFPPPPAEFEVAEIKVSPPDAGGGRGGVRPEIKNGRVYLPGITLKNLIAVAWDIAGDDLMANVPKWMNEDRFDVIAKAPSGVALGDLSPQRTGVPVNIDALRPMIRALVVDRFKLATHMEERPVNAYILSAVKPKLSKADPASRTRWHEGVDAEAKGKNANASLGRLVMCQNVTMAQFAEMLPSIAPGYLHTDVVDGTGLEGGWDFTFSFSPLGALQSAGGHGGDAGTSSEGGPSAGAPAASDPNGTLSLFDAVTKELGLKLEIKKRPTPVLVIDHVERKPVEN